MKNIRFVYKILLIFIFGIFVSCEDDDYIEGDRYKFNRELYISGISTTFNFTSHIMSFYSFLAENLCNTENKELFKKESYNEQIRINSLGNKLFHLWHNFDIVYPVKNNDDFLRSSICIPTDVFSVIRPSREREQVLVDNKFIVLTWVVSYLLQCKKNCESHLANDDSKVDFNNRFYEHIVRKLFNGIIYQIISNRFKDGTDKNKNDEEISIFDLLKTVCSHVDEDKNMYDFFSENILGNNIININNININDKREFGFLWTIYKKKENIS